MGRKEHADTPQAGYVCPACHQPVSAELTRHKTMGVFVPQRRPGHCHNPGCPEYAPEERHPESSTRTVRELHGHH